ncbi:MAG: UvrB/UvrC motif-containing protein, partial [Leptospirales bacterium]|nr:UvrB/UvrC motif-containing protein [Leptospirales bacterium]
VIKSCHGDKKHSGKIPPYFSEEEIIFDGFLDENVSDVKELKENLLAAVQDERYEDAAVLRDKINLAIKNGIEHN